MQSRMKTYQLSEEKIQILLESALVGRIATLNSDGYPYIVPVHFVVFDEKIYIHGLNRGQKISNLENDSRVSFEIDKMQGIVPEASPETACDVNTKYESIIIIGQAKMEKNLLTKKKVLGIFMQKYAPKLADLPMPDEAIEETGVIVIDIEDKTGKYYA